ncbi:MAG: hypothetical protein N3E46_05520, partial [Gemmataceae bacterium]|nr:hypothetical protein [Gemmataceae bacterium]
MILMIGEVKSTGRAVKARGDTRECSPLHSACHLGGIRRLPWPVSAAYWSGCRLMISPCVAPRFSPRPSDDAAVD